MLIRESDALRGLLAFKPSSLIKALHAEQKRALRLGARFSGIVAGRRSGKSYLVATWLLEKARPGSVSLYCARTLKSAKAIMLPIFFELNQKHQLGLQIRSVDGEILLPNGAVIRLHGLHDKPAAELLRGQHFDKVVVDEAGAFDCQLLEFCIEAILQPTLFDSRGPMIVTGSPGPLKSGYFYKLVGNPLGTGEQGRWPTHAWDLRSNPYIKDSETTIKEILETNGWTEEHHRFQREILGRFIDDAGSLIYKYQGERWAQVPDAGKTVLGVDFAFSDKATADSTTFVVGRQPYDQRPHVYVVEAIAKHGINMAEIAATIRQLKAKWGIGTVTVDAGAGGAGYYKSLNESFNLDVEAADKRDKRARIDVAVATLDTRTVHICPEAAGLVSEWESLTWDEKHTTHHERCADDLSDAFLYMLQHFTVVERPASVITQLSEQQAQRKRVLGQAARGNRSPV